MADAYAVQSKFDLKELDTLNIAGETDQVTFYGVTAKALDPGTDRYVANNVKWKYDLLDGTRKMGENGLLGFDKRYPYTNLVFEIPGFKKWAMVGDPFPLSDGVHFQLNFMTD